MTAITAPKCPTCGAPLELLPDGTCRWCHASVGQSADGMMATGNKFMRLGESWENHWTLSAPPGSRHSIPWDMGDELMTPAREMVTVLAQGLTQPGLQALAATHKQDPDLDWQFTLVVNDVISAGIEANLHDGPHAYLQMCDLLEALAHYKGTDPQWAAAAADCAAMARTHFQSAWVAAVEGDDPDPFRVELAAWSAKHMKHPGDERHHWWKH